MRTLLGKKRDLVVKNVNFIFILADKELDLTVTYKIFALVLF